jgi:hypothetical protein
MEVKKSVFKRVPPGDRWIEIEGDPEKVFPNLTEALEHYFQKTGLRQYYIDAAGGSIMKVTEEPDPPVVPPTYSIYGDSL